jgi:hypothetical protein
MITTILKARVRDEIYWVGIVLMVLSLIAFCLPLLSKTDSNLSGFFLFNYGFAVIYLIVLLKTGRLDEGRKGLSLLFFLLILLLISAFAFNREMVVFKSIDPALTVLMVIVCANYLLLDFFAWLPPALQHITLVVLGIGLMLFGYLAFYLLPFSGFGIIGFPLLGIPLLVFVPLLLTGFTIKLAIRLSGSSRAFWCSLAGGAVAFLLFILAFSIKCEMGDIDSFSL